ncbi:hypothetical protein C7379_10468 [Hallella colorans]|uniref:Uncharacterized protein n=1 Tax=Hallella colorans TaxID=1703337 RepID=A0A2U0UIG3_9BACT|nr:hypothetical protein C7379_10468 [Hallella colorans]
MSGMFNDENNTFMTKLLLCNNALSCTPSAMYERWFCASYLLVVKLISISLKDSQCLNKECVNDAPLIFKELTITKSQAEKRLGYNLSVCHGREWACHFCSDPMWLNR